jgi:CRISPR-associated protein Cas1
LLSLGYTLAEHSLGAMVGRYGLEIGVGFLHTPHRGRPSLLLDLLEPVRPWVDEWMWQRAQQGGLTPKHFYSDKTLGCRLEKEGRELFWPAWYDEGEAWLHRPMRDSLASMLKRLRHYRYPVAEDTE